MEPTDIVQDADFDAAARSGAQRLKKGPVAVAARYELFSGRVVIELDSGLEIGFKPQQAQGLEAATPAHLGEIELSPSGQGLYFPAVDADLYLPALLEGFLGSKAWMAARMGQAGGRAKTQAKQAAARANGWLGGRPRKKNPLTPA